MTALAPRRARTRLLCLSLTLALTPLAHAQDATDAFKLKLGYTGEAASMIDGGRKSGDAYAGQLMVGTDVDMDRLFGWNGATVKLYVTNRHGTNLANSSIGNSTSVQEIYGGQGTRLTNFTPAAEALQRPPGAGSRPQRGQHPFPWLGPVPVLPGQLGLRQPHLRLPHQ